MAIDSLLWDLEDDPDGNVQHCAEHGITMEEVEEVFQNVSDADISRSSGRPVVFGDTHKGLFDPNVVKVVRDANHRALYFSRAPIPYARDHFPKTALPDRLPDGAQWLRHIGIYAYRVGVLHRYVHWPRHSLEAMESLEQLRILGMGERIHVDLACAPVPAGVDTPDDLARVRALFAADSTARAAADGT